VDRRRRGKPLAIRSDNGPEYISGTFIVWAARQGIRLDHIQPGNQQQNAYIERYNRTVRYDWLSHYLFESISEVQNYATDWMWTYNHERPNMALGGITPKQKSALLTHSTSDRCQNGGITKNMRRPVLAEYRIHGGYPFCRRGICSRRVFSRFWPLVFYL